MQIQFFGATHEVTGSCYLITVGESKLLVECGLVQGSHEHERHNSDEFPFSAKEIDAVVLSHAHIDHSGRLPLLVKRGFSGDIYSHSATVDLCAIMLADSGYLNEKNAHWENKKRERKGLELIDPLYTKEQAQQAPPETASQHQHDNCPGYSAPAGPERKTKERPDPARIADIKT